MAHLLSSKRRAFVALSVTLLVSAGFLALPGAPSKGAANAASVLDPAGTRVVQVEDGKSACPQPAAPAYDVNAITANVEILLVHQARLEAELQGQNFVLPAQLQRYKDEPATVQAFAEEEIAFRSRAKALTTQVETMRKASQQGQQEIEIMKSKAAIVERQTALLRQRLANVTALVTRGIMPAVEKMNAEQNVSQYEMAAYDLQLAIARAQNERMTVERNMADLVAQRRDENSMDLVQTKSKLASLFAQARAANAAQKSFEEAALRQTKEDCDKPHYSSYVVKPGPGSTVQVMRVNAAGEPISPPASIAIPK